MTMHDNSHRLLLRKAGLVYVSDQEPGIKRERKGRGFCYRMPDGSLLCDTEIRKRIKTLGLPPAYKDVWICLLDNGHLQATGIDARGRKQYRYHTDWHALRDEKKFHSLAAFGEALPRIRRRARRDAQQTDDGEIATLGALVLLLDAAHLRVGNKAYLEENGTYGATTLLKRHVSFGDMLELHFTAKGGRKVRHRLRAPRLQKILEHIADLPGRQLFVWKDADGDVHPVDSGRLNRYLSELAGEGMSAKTFRTWGGSLAAFECAIALLEEDTVPLIKALSEASAMKLLNTPAISRKSYIHPQILALATEADARDLLRRQMQMAQKPVEGLRAAEQRMITFLGAV